MTEHKFVVRTVFMMKMETLCFAKIIARHEKKHRNSRIWPILAMPDFLAKVKRKLLQRSLNADTNHHSTTTELCRSDTSSRALFIISESARNTQSP